jgi:hypothetical protein
MSRSDHSELTDSELAAALAAIEVTWPRRRAGAPEAAATTPVWRWSGRWWGPVYAEGGAAARVRPWRR